MATKVDGSGYAGEDEPLKDINNRDTRPDWYISKFSLATMRRDLRETKRVS